MCFERWTLLAEGFPGGSVVKNLPAMQEARVRFLDWDDPLKKEMATHSSILAWRILWTEKPGGLQSMGSKKSWIRLRVVGSLKYLCVTPLNTKATAQEQLCWLSGETCTPLHRIL